MRCYERPLIKREFASMSQQQEPAIYGLWRAEWRRMQKSRTALFSSLLWSAPTKLYNCPSFSIISLVFYTITLFSTFSIFSWWKHCSTNKRRRAWDDNNLNLDTISPTIWTRISRLWYLFFYFFFFLLKKVDEGYMK